MKNGMIFDIKEFSVFDGPGIRQTVFLKGCPLSCSWCHNPEGQKSAPEAMASKTECRYCHQQQWVSLSNKCTHCGHTLPVLPVIVGEEISSVELVRRIRINSEYYSKYGGGVTFSGGEPLMQASFLLDVMAQIPDLHLAIETSGYCSSRNFSSVIERMNYVMLDIKIFDSFKHQRYTGLSNEKILENASFLCAGKIPFVIRIPLIPGVNDNNDNFISIAKFLYGAGSLIKVELLPYHRTAGAKYHRVGRVYEPGFDEDRKVHASTRIFSDYGIRSEIL